MLIFQWPKYFVIVTKTSDLMNIMHVMLFSVFTLLHLHNNT